MVDRGGVILNDYGPFDLHSPVHVFLRPGRKRLVRIRFLFPAGKEPTIWSVAGQPFETKLYRYGSNSCCLSLRCNREVEIQRGQVIGRMFLIDCDSSDSSEDSLSTMDRATWKVGEGGVNPTLNEDGSLNLYCPELTVVPPGRMVLIHSRIDMQFPYGKLGILKSPAGRRFKTTSLQYKSGWYLFVMVQNKSDRTVEIERGEVIGRMIMEDDSDTE